MLRDLTIVALAFFGGLLVFPRLSARSQENLRNWFDLSKPWK
jgi:hypothetical protein